MEEVQQSYQNGHSKVYTEVSEDGTITEYEERYVLDDDSDPAPIAYGASEEVVLLQDDDDVKVYQRQELLPDGREIITTTTITVNEKGEAVEETVTEIVESKEVELEEEEEEESADELIYETPVPVHSLKSGLEDSTSSAEVPDTFEEEKAEEVETNTPVEPVKAISRRISYEEFAEQYTEYKPPKRYEKKQQSTTADKVAPKLRIMTSETGEEEGNTGEKGLPNTDSLPASHIAASPHDTLTSPGSRHSSHGENMAEDASFSSQPTRTQGSVIRSISTDSSSARQGGRTRSRSFDQLAFSVGGYEDYNRYIKGLPGYIRDRAWMDQNSTVDPANVVKADDKPDLEAELPSRGTSQSLKSKFQAMGGVDPRQIDFSQPVKREKPRSNQDRGSVGAVMNNDVESSHRIPEFEGGEIENTPEVRLDVVREADKNILEELPEIGQAKTLLSKWNQIETELSTRKEYTPSGVGSKPTVTPLRPSSRVVTEDVEAEPEGGEYENTPVERTDVIKETDTPDLELELPSVGLAKSIMSQFKQKEEEAKMTPVYQPSGAGSRAPKANTRTSSISSADSHPEPQFEGGAVENVPVLRDDVVRESDVEVKHELPEPGYAKNVKARFRELQEQQMSSDYVEHRPSGVASKVTPTPHRLSGGAALSSSISSIPSSDEVDSRIEPQLEAGEYESQPMKRTDVVREEDRFDEQELPEAGLARNLMDRFKTLESQKPQTYKPSGVGAKATPSKLHIMAGKSSYSAKGIILEPVMNSDVVEEVPQIESGEYENTPMVRDDVIRADTRVEHDNLPEQGVTKNIRSHFKSLEQENQATIQHRPSKIASKPTPTPLRTSSAAAEVSETVNDFAAAGQEPVDVETVAEVNCSTTKSSDPNQNEFAPTVGIAKSLMNN
ncbi:microtubule-associated protein futsch-like [Watersipora subatra]|uniref:microtubule-associated protein futsch-like n=1 Tax=Watersipora subatra TaxID=2589382 RepID=UPI00355B9F7B